MCLPLVAGPLPSLLNLVAKHLKKCVFSVKPLFVEPPSEPREPGIVNFDNKSVTLRWNKPVDDGGRPITHFVIQKKDQFGGRRRKEGEV